MSNPGEFSDQELHVYSVIVGLIKDNLSFPSQKKIVGGTGLSANTVRKCLNSLDDRYVINLDPSYVPGSRLSLLFRGTFRMRGNENAGLSLDRYSQHWLASQSSYMSRSTTTYLGCWENRDKALQGLAELGWRPIASRDEFGFCVDNEGSSIVSTEKVLLIATLFRQADHQVASKVAWYEACNDLAKQFGWDVNTSGILRGYSSRLPDGLVEFSNVRSRCTCRLTEIGVSAIQNMLSGKVPFVTTASMPEKKREELRSKLRRLTIS